MVVLVGFASEHGSTRGIAERIAQRLRRRGFDVEVSPFSEVADVRPYGSFVLGSAVHGGKWLPDGATFVYLHHALLKQHPVWLFSVSTLGDEESMFPPRIARRLRSMRKETPEISAFRAEIEPRQHRNFAGAVEPSHWPVTGRAFFRATGGRYGDHRNWLAVDAWADAIATDLAAEAIPGRAEPSQG